jgi:hypothetical protein
MPRFCFGSRLIDAGLSQKKSWLVEHGKQLQPTEVHTHSMNCLDSNHSAAPVGLALEQECSWIEPLVLLSLEQLQQQRAQPLVVPESIQCHSRAIFHRGRVSLTWAGVVFAIDKISPKPKSALKGDLHTQGGPLEPHRVTTVPTAMHSSPTGPLVYNMTLPNCSFNPATVSFLRTLHRGWVRLQGSRPSRVRLGNLLP